LTNSQKGTDCHSCKGRKLLNSSLLLNLYSDACQEHLNFLTFCDSVMISIIVKLKLFYLQKAKNPSEGEKLYTKKLLLQLNARAVRYI
jgi:hypothetical protein